MMHFPSPLARCRKLMSLPRLSSFPPKALASISVLVFGCLSAQADDSTGVHDFWGLHTLDVQTCAGVLEGSEGEFATAAHCVQNQLFSRLLDVTVQVMEEHGDALFGEHFHLDHRLDFSASGGGISGGLDAVIPLNFFTAVSGDRVTRALFLQNGVTRWRDGQGFQRNDMRFGVVHRMAMSDAHLDGGVFGAWVFFQENLEREHARVVTGLDYTDRWGTGSLRYFMPITDWRSGRLGFKERALEGVEFEVGTAATRTVMLSAAAGHWENRNGSGDWGTRGRLRIGWQPNRWLGLRASWEDIGTADDSLGLHVLVKVPFDDASKSPRWEGLGIAARGATPSTSDLWRPITGIGEIAVASTMDIADLVENAEIRFLQDTVGSGDVVNLEVVIPAAAPQDVRAEVRLVPGNGQNPAVPGEDFVDEPVETTIRQGTTSSTVSIPLLQNNNMQENRSLSATVSLIS